MPEIIHPVALPYKSVDLSWLVGTSVTAVVLDSSATWRFLFDSGAAIGSESLWRIIVQGRIARTSKDHNQQFGLPLPVDAAAEATELLSAKLVSSVRVREATADLLVECGHAIALEFVADSTGYESWLVCDGKGANYVAQGGGQIAMWRA
jgi:hypothetical protein